MAVRTFPATLEAFPDASAFLEAELEAADCGMKSMMQIAVAFEELFVNVAHYAYPGTEGEVTVEITAENGTARIRLIDGGIPFDPVAKADPDVTLSAEDRDIGGLGIYMVKRSMDSLDYVYEDGKNKLTFTKAL